MNNTQQPIGGITIEAAADMDNAARFVGFDGNLCGAGAKCAGVIDTTYESGEQMNVVPYGIMLVETAGTFSLGAALVSDASGKALAATTFSATVPSGSTPVLSSGAQPAMTLAGSVLPQAINGYAMEACTASGQKIQVRLV